MFRPTKVIDNNCKTPAKMAEESNQNIQVFVRCRPLNVNEKKGLVDVINEKRFIKTSHQQSSKLYTFDNVFDAKATQIDVYRSVVEPLVEQVIEGYNCTVFAYGQTGTGKTYTMIGNRSDNEVSWEEDPTSGIIPRAIDQLLEDLQNQDTEYTVRVSYLELYNEDAYDLLSPLSDTNKLRIYNDTERKGSVIISGLVELIVKTKAEIFEILKKGSTKRQTAPTLMNACSSRSHSIFSITVHIKEVTLDGEEVVKMGKLNLVDLAGSENIGRSGAVEERAREASNINKSLLTLGRVITSLVEKSSHIPYRDSKLTRLLQDSLGGKTKTSIIATISPGADDFEDTVSTLDYAQRAKKITNKPEINLKMSKKTLISEYLGEIDKLRRDLEAARDKKGIYVDAKNYSEMQETLKTQEQALEAKEVRIDHLISELNKTAALLTETTQGLNVKCEELESTKNDLNYVRESLQQTSQELTQVKEQIQEHRVLLEAHQSTEKRLHSEANSIMQVADRCINDNDFLFKKIDTFSQIEDNNWQQLRRFKDDYSEKVTQLDDINSVILNRFNDSHKTIENIVQTSKVDTINQEEKIKTNLNKIQTRIDLFEGDFLQILSQERLTSEVSASLKEMVAKFKQSLVDEFATNTSVLNEKQNRSNSLLEELRTKSLKNHSEIEELVLNQINKVNDLSKHVISTIQLIQNDFNQAYKSKCLENQQLVDEMEALRNGLNSTGFEKRLKALIDSAQQLSQDYCHSTEGFSSKINELKTKVQDIHSKETNLKEGLSFKSSEFLNFFKDEQKDFTMALTNFDLQNNQQCQQIVDKCQQVSSIQQELVNEYSVMKEKSLANVDEVSVDLQNNIDCLNEHILDSANKQQKNLSAFKVDILEHLSASNTLMDELAAQIDKSSQDTLKECIKVDSSYNSLQTTHRIRIDELHFIANQLLENGYKLYQATGQTPKKCTYSYSRTLSATSPHERIIQRFRAKAHQEAPNLSLPSEDETSSITSCDSDKSNLENNNNAENCQDQVDKIFTKNILPDTALVRRKFLKEKN